MRHFSLIFLAFSFALGTASLWFFQALPSIPCASSAALACFILSYFLRKQLIFIPVLFAMLSGFLWCIDQSEKVLSARIPSTLEGVPLTVIGTITAIPEGDPQNLHMDFLIQKIVNSNAWQPPKKIRLSWYMPKENTAALHVGETWQLSVKLKQPRSTFNLASFDYEAWLFSHRISAVGYVIDKAHPQKISAPKWKTFMNTWRENIQEQLEQALQNNPNLGLIESLAIGVRDQLSTAQWQAMQATGTNHLVAIAGLHIGFVVGFTYLLMNFLWRRIPFLMLYLPAQEAAIIFSLLGALYYSALAGFALPTQRACIMLSVALCAKLCRRNIPPFHALSLALFGILAYDPLSVFSESFWLSFVAVAMILFCMRDKLSRRSRLTQALYIQYVVALGLAPLTLYFFHQISVMNFLANAIAIPWVGFLGLPLILLGVLIAPIWRSGAKILWGLTAKIFAFYWPLMTWLSNIDQWQWHTYMTSLWQFLAAMAGCVILLIPKKFPLRFLGVLGFLPLIFYTPEPLAPGEIKLSQLDVGQGLSTLIQTAHHRLIFDAGAALSASYDMGESVVAPAVQYAQVSSVDLLLISHSDNDHSGGAKAVLQHFPVKTLLTSAPQLYSALPATLPWHRFNIPYGFLQKHWPAPKVLSCETGQYWDWDGVHFEMLNPDSDYTPRKTNDQCCVLRISNAYHSILLPGDIEKMTETRLLSRLKPTEIVIAPHHGSKTSSSEAFIQALQPAWVIYATGYRNKFHFPHPEVIERYAALHAQSLDTAQDGEIMIDIPNRPGALTALKTRKTYGHFWNF